MSHEFRITWVCCQSVQIERTFTEEELVRRMKAWVTVDLSEVIEIVNRFGRLKVLDDPELFIEVKKVEDFRNLQKALRETRGRGGSRKNCQKVVVQCTECHPRENSFEKPHNIDKL